jgi:hypothetical protein
MCVECGCYGAVNPYGIGGRDVNKPPVQATVKKSTVSKAKKMEMEYEEDD